MLKSASPLPYRHRSPAINFSSAKRTLAYRSYVKDLKENRSSYEVLLLENKKLLQFFIHYNLLAEQAVNRLLDQSLQKSDMEIRSMLLNYQDEIQNEDKKEETGSQLDQLLAALS